MLSKFDINKTVTHCELHTESKVCYQPLFIIAVTLSVILKLHCIFTKNVTFLMVMFMAFFDRYQYLTRKKKYFRNWWMKMFHSWELLGLLRWPMLITLHCLKRRKRRNGKRPTLFSASIFHTLTRILFSDIAYTNHEYIDGKRILLYIYLDDWSIIICYGQMFLSVVVSRTSLN